MQPAKIFALGLLLLRLCAGAYAQQTATTDDGRKVILKTDGTWEYTKKEATVRTNSVDFRKSNWGMSKKQVKATESGKIVRDDETALVYSGEVSGLDALIGYIFVDSKLVRTKYIFLPKHTNQNDFIQDYGTVKAALTEKYGTPKSDNTYWRNELYKSDYSEWGFAVSLGHLVYTAEWETESSKINIILSGENYKVHLSTEYASKRFENLEDAAQQKKKASEF
ncbi:MAG: hypothetical protein NTZ35_08040 [Ignavibacteriales bacterium]|nr:hypothetical protein [Ignavibacteriales bacterium]